MRPRPAAAPRARLGRLLACSAASLLDAGALAQPAPDGGGAASEADPGGAAREADPLCFSGQGRSAEQCCGHPPHTGPCQWGALLSHGYCCDLASECFAWGVSIAGDDTQDPVPARTGLECRHLCQAQPACQAWTFVLSTFPEADLRYSCWLKGRAWTAAEAASRRAGLVSGTRHCPRAHGRLLQGLLRRSADLQQAPRGALPSADWGRDPQRAAAEAAGALAAQGWAVVHGALGPAEAEGLRAASAAALAALEARDPARAGNRGPRRYSLGSASLTHHMAHLPEWAGLIDSPRITPVLELIFGEDYVAIGGGGDVVLGHTDTVQWLHVDLPRWGMYDRVRPPPGVGVNFVVEDIECNGGPMRLVPGTHTLPFQLDRMAPESETQMLEQLGLARVYLCPLRRGDAVLRDLRVWHAGSANTRPEARHLPNAEFLAGWYADLTEGTDDHLAPRRAIPQEVWAGLSLRAQRVSRRARAEGPLQVGFRESIALPQQFD